MRMKVQSMQLSLRLALITLLLTGATSQVAAKEQHSPSTVDSEAYRIRVQTVADGLEHPWALALLPDGRYLVTERNPGRLRIGTAEGELSEVGGVPEIFRYKGDTGRSQAGLFDVKLDPDFPDTHRILLSYSQPTERGAALTVSRARLVEDDGGARLEDLETVYEMKEADQDSSGLHFGGRMAIHPDGSIYLTTGERRNLQRAQDTHDQAGAVLRFGPDGDPHPENPFYGATPDDDSGGDPLIHSYGHRNPQGLAIHPDNREVWINDHGPLGGDEINLIEVGNNYGWPFVTGGTDYSGAPLGLRTETEDFTSPVHIFERTVAPSGLVFYEGDAFSEWQGDMLHGGMSAEAVIRVSLDESRQVASEEWIELGRRIRDVQVDERGAVWLVTEHEDGEVLRLLPEAAVPPEDS